VPLDELDEALRHEDAPTKASRTKHVFPLPRARSQSEAMDGVHSGGATLGAGDGLGATQAAAHIIHSAAPEAGGDGEIAGRGTGLGALTLPPHTQHFDGVKAEQPCQPLGSKGISHALGDEEVIARGLDEVA
jgi:hypothetical protein